MRSSAPDIRNTAPTAVEPEIVENEGFWRPPPFISAFAGCMVPVIFPPIGGVSGGVVVSVWPKGTDVGGREL